LNRWAVIAASLGVAIIAALAWPGARTPVANNAAPRQCLDPASDAQGVHPGMVWVPGGRYTMGDTVYPEEGPPRKVRVAGFWMDRHEVTNRQFAAFVRATRYVTEAERVAHRGAMVFVMPAQVGDMSDISQWWRYMPDANWRHPAGPGSSIEGREDYPVVEVTYADARAYAHWAHRELPSEAEWEWAAREADPNAMPNHRQPEEANTWQGVFPVQNSGEDGFFGLAPSGCYRPNRLGLYDMIGNVWEWTSSLFTPDHSEAEGYTLAPDSMPRMMGDNEVGDNEVSYTIKGGSYLCAPDYCMRYRSGARQPQEANLGASHLGFRTILRAPPPQSQP
jgi:formylglycine-generating enzyme required for sulfatase activity